MNSKYSHFRSSQHNIKRPSITLNEMSKIDDLLNDLKQQPLQRIPSRKFQNTKYNASKPKQQNLIKKMSCYEHESFDFSDQASFMDSQTSTRYPTDKTDRTLETRRTISQRPNTQRTNISQQFDNINLEGLNVTTQESQELSDFIQETYDQPLLLTDSNNYVSKAEKNKLIEKLLNVYNVIQEKKIMGSQMKEINKMIDNLEKFVNKI